MPLLLDIPYIENKKAKECGCKWSPEFNKWYTPANKSFYPNFEKWISNNNGNVIICDYFYIIKTKRICYNCYLETDVIALGIENFYSTDKLFYNSGDIRVSPILFDSLPDEIIDSLCDHFDIFLRHFLNPDKPFSNYCNYCNARQGNYYLFKTPQSPFILDSFEKFQSFELFKVNLKYDFISNVDISYPIIDTYLKICDVKNTCRIHRVNLEKINYSAKKLETINIASSLPTEILTQPTSKGFTIFRKVFSFVVVLVFIVNLLILLFALNINHSDSKLPSAEITSNATSGNNQNRNLSLSFIVGNHPGARGTYIMIKDGEKTLTSKIYSKGSKLEFYSDKSLVITTNNSDIKEFIINNDIVEFEVANSYTKIYHNGNTIKFTNRFNYDFNKDMIIN